jgi:hypothetical protein
MRYGDLIHFDPIETVVQLQGQIRHHKGPFLVGDISWIGFPCSTCLKRNVPSNWCITPSRTFRIAPRAPACLSSTLQTAFSSDIS